jgi:cystathionine beta-lyase/cystathionine gamma-synthase
MSGTSTTALHSGYTPNDDDGAIIPPLYLSATFKNGNKKSYEYSRSGNPTRETLEHTLAALDGAQFGLAYASGSAALANITSILAHDEEVLFSSDAYGGTYRYMTQVLTPQGIKHRIVDLTDEKATQHALKTYPIKLIWIETPTNPLLKVTDITSLAQLAHDHGAILVVDNTFATPVIQKPLELGADIVVYSTTKYMNGHSDSIGGSLAVNDEVLYKKLSFLQNAIGAMLAPFDAWLTLRGLRTLEVRMERHIENAQTIARFLSKHPKISRVHYPGLFTGEQGRIVSRQMKHPGAMISLELTEAYDPQKFLSKLQYFPLAESLGGVESLIDHPASMTHASIPKKEREKIGLSDGLFRVSVGIENKEDLLADLKQALNSL